MEGKPVKGKFIWMEGEERRKAVQRIKNKISSGAFSSSAVMQEIADKLGPHFASSIGEEPSNLL